MSDFTDEGEASWVDHMSDLTDLRMANLAQSIRDGGKKVTIFFDGGTRISDRHAAGAAVVYDTELNEIASVAKYLPNVTTNNVAEYTGLIVGLNAALLLGATEVVAYGDSELVVRQVKQIYETRKAHLRPLRNEVWDLGRQFQTVEIKETLRGGKQNKRRNNNERADELCNICMDSRANISTGVGPYLER